MKTHWVFGGAILATCMVTGVLQASGVTVRVPSYIRFVSRALIQERQNDQSIPSDPSHDARGLEIRAAGLSASFLIAGSATNLINIAVKSDESGQERVQEGLECAYAGSAYGPCTIIGASAPGAGKVLSVGMAPKDPRNGAPGEILIPTFSVTVTYQ